MRIFSVTIPDNKKIDIALTYVYGIGHPSSIKILESAGISTEKRAKEMRSEDVQKIQGAIEKTYRIEGELRQEIRRNIDRLKEIKAYRGIRHARRLPAHGQRTKTNSRTIRGNVRKTAGSGKRKVDLK